MEQKSGFGSKNYQINEIKIQSGMTPEQANKLTLELFFENFPKLQAEAINVAKTRVDEFMNVFFTRLSDSNFSDYYLFSNPDIQCVVFEAQKNYARYGTDELQNILLSLLEQRLNANNSSMLTIALNEAITKISLLTPLQMDILSFIFVLKRSKFNVVNQERFEYLIIKHLTPFLSTMPKYIDIEHLQYCGCVFREAGRILGQQLLLTYGHIFIRNSTTRYNEKNYDELKIVINDNEVYFRDYLRSFFPLIDTMILNYDRNLKDVYLTSVGLAIGVTNLKMKKIGEYDLSKWF